MAPADHIDQNLPRVLVAALAVTGSRDPVVAPAWAQAAAALVPLGRYVPVQGGAHGVNFSHPVELSAIVRNFLERQELRLQGRAFSNRFRIEQNATCPYRPHK